MKLTKHEFKEIIALSAWFNVQPDKLIHKILQDQLQYIRSIQYECAKDECSRKKYELAQRLSLLD